MVPISSDIAAIAAIARDRGHARVPVYDGSVDNVVGFVNVRQVLAQATICTDFTLAPYVHPVPFVADSMPAPALLKHLQALRTHLALVIDEQGTIVGLVTVEDLLEELVGDILSENDTPLLGPTREADGAWSFPGSTPLHEVSKRLAVDLPEGDFATLAGLCLSLAGTIPTAGTVLQTKDGVVLEVVEATPRRVRHVRIRRLGKGPNAGA